MLIAACRGRHASTLPTAWWVRIILTAGRIWLISPAWWVRIIRTAGGIRIVRTTRRVWVVRPTRRVRTARIVWVVWIVRLLWCIWPIGILGSGRIRAIRSIWIRAVGWPRILRERQCLQCICFAILSPDHEHYRCNHCDWPASSSRIHGSVPQVSRY